MFGTGVTRIKYAYANARIKPKFTITDHIISVILPVISGKYNVTDDEDRVVMALENGDIVTEKIQILRYDYLNKKTKMY